jgi:hypothetical protein
LLSGTLELLMTGGVNPSLPPERPSSGGSPRSRGIKKGLFIFLMTFLIVPIIAIITIMVRAEPFAVVIASILLGVGGLLRMAYALMFESAESGRSSLDRPTADQGLPAGMPIADLPSGEGSFAPPYFAPQGTPKKTNDLQLASVIEGTTRLLENEPFDQ